MKFSNKFFLGTKGKMTQVFDEKGVVHAATMIVAAPLTVTQVKTKDKDGYEAVQVGSGVRREKNVAKAQQGHLSAKGGSASGGKGEEKKEETEPAKVEKEEPIVTATPRKIDVAAPTPPPVEEEESWGAIPAFLRRHKK